MPWLDSCDNTNSEALLEVDFLGADANFGVVGVVVAAVVADRTSHSVA